ncbi:MAG TPA: acetyl-CoA carboxylase biotin carboxylase subunit, partial [Blastocatellia bacterium]|nr:acetyl-CoA carboxylase biotin carboxylase subunit [Blastocatellia bacterium]
VAVYSEADRESLHVRFADDDVCIGPAPARDSYLRIPRLIAAAEITGADAIHPGYGFLAENAEFAETCAASNIAFIGPTPEQIRVMGDKAAARKAMMAVGVPVVPGTPGGVEDVDEALEFARKIGFPVIIKAAAGGGGKGMRMVRSREQIGSALDLAQSEAAASFKDSSVYVEKFIERPRHIEIQLIGDRYGEMVYLGERECSLQRRHQKVVEECPSPIVDEDLRRRMGEAAVRIARHAGYANAGTVEFLVDPQRNFYFLEMNTRLQVEHPVTELVTARDLVHEQIRVAAGEKLSFSQSDIVMRGAAIECRIYAEDPYQNFLPSPGRITRVVTPAGPGVRYDSGSYSGWEVPIYYDPLLAKLCVWAETRAAAIDRLARVLDEYTVEGINTTVPFFRAVVRNEEFRRGEFDTGFIERFLKDGFGARESVEDESAQRLEDMAAIAAALHARAHARQLEAATPRSAESRWKLYGRLNQRR